MIPIIDEKREELASLCRQFHVRSLELFGSAVTGDFVLTGEEVNPVIAALRTNGIEVTALHSHMLNEQPRLFFMHFWANDDAMKLAKGLRAALDKTSRMPQ